MNISAHKTRSVQMNYDGKIDDQEGVFYIGIHS